MIMSKNLEEIAKEKSGSKRIIRTLEVIGTLKHSAVVDSKKYNKFLAKHNRHATKLNAPIENVRSNYSYIYTPTSAGTQVEVLCCYCKKKEDITDYDCW